MDNNLEASAHIEINASPERVWEGLTKPDIVREYFFGTELDTTWEPGTPLYFRGEWEGKKYEDRGKVLKNKKPELLQYSYWSSMSGTPNLPENYVTVTYQLEKKEYGTHLIITQSPVKDEKTRDHSEQNWLQVMEGLKKILEAKS
jgi:uncharacterized protein YndB with AHSA1/START domain